MEPFRVLVLALFVSMALVTVPLMAAAGPTSIAHGEDVLDGTSPALEDDENETTTAAAENPDDEPSTETTVGYVEGVWYYDDLPIDEEDEAVVGASDFEAIVYRSMARVEVLRDLTFQEDVPVDVISREQFQAARDGADDEDVVEETERLQEAIRYEALFMIDRETDVDDEFSTLLGDAVQGFYSPVTNRVVIVSDSPSEPELDEVTLAHELLHALQDQHFDLQRFEPEIQNQEHAKDGLVEGDAVWVENEYERRCDVEWSCVLPGDEPEDDDGPDDPHWGLYLELFYPYSDGASFVDHLREEGGWEAVNAAYDDPPRSSSEIIRPEEYANRSVSEMTVEDRSNDRWTELDVDDGPAYSEFGEATIAAMLAYPTLADDGNESIIPGSELINGDETNPLNYDHAYTDGWAGDRLIKYVTDERTIDESGYVWETVWESEEDAAQFVDGYLQLLEIHDAGAIQDHENTFVIEDGFPGAYYLEHDGETVTIVRAPSVGELDEIRAGAAPEQFDSILPDPGAETLGELDWAIVLAGLFGALTLTLVLRRRFG